MKFYTPKKENGFKQPYLDDLWHLLDLHEELTRQRCIQRMEESKARMKHIANLEKLYQAQQQVMVTKWNPHHSK